MLVLNGREVSRKSLEVENVCGRDYPDFCDAYIAYGEFVDGVALSDSELELLNENGVLVNQLAHESFFLKV